MAPAPLAGGGGGGRGSPTGPTPTAAGGVAAAGSGRGAASSPRGGGQAGGGRVCCCQGCTPGTLRRNGVGGGRGEGERAKEADTGRRGDGAGQGAGASRGRQAKAARGYATPRQAAQEHPLPARDRARGGSRPRRGGLCCTAEGTRGDTFTTRFEATWMRGPMDAWEFHLVSIVMRASFRCQGEWKAHFLHLVPYVAAPSIQAVVGCTGAPFLGGLAAGGPPPPLPSATPGGEGAWDSQTTPLPRCHSAQTGRTRTADPPARTPRREKGRRRRATAGAAFFLARAGWRPSLPVAPQEPHPAPHVLHTTPPPVLRTSAASHASTATATATVVALATARPPPTPPPPPPFAPRLSATAPGLQSAAASPAASEPRHPRLRCSPPAPPTTIWRRRRLGLLRAAAAEGGCWAYIPSPPPCLPPPVARHGADRC